MAGNESDGRLESVLADSSGDEYEPDSQSETEQEEFDDYCNDRNGSKIAHSKIVDSSEAEEEFQDCISMPSSRKRSSKHLTNKSPVPKQSRMQRNKSHASKITCCDAQEVKNFLCSEKQCCDKECLMKLQQFKNDAFATSFRM